MSRPEDKIKLKRYKYRVRFIDGVFTYTSSGIDSYTATDKLMKRLRKDTGIPNLESADIGIEFLGEIE